MITAAEFADNNYLVPVPAPTTPQPSSSVVYITGSNDRWDSLAYRFYGDPMQFPNIVMANPEVPISGILPPNTKIYIPQLLPLASPYTPNEPPWL